MGKKKEGRLIACLAARCMKSVLLTTLFYFMRQYVKPCIGRLAVWRKATAPTGVPSKRPFDVRIAFICDDMTWETFSPLCRASVYVTPTGWKRTLESFKPDLLFCEAAWHGIKSCPEAWQGRVFRNHRVLFENRRALIQIVAYCRAHGIRTVFWNKEDPAYFGDTQRDFTDTALLFDHIFTTAEECIARYQALGHPSVHLMQFGFSPELFNPFGRSEHPTGAVYAGSWFPDHPERCKDMEKIFDQILAQGMELSIYDRQMRPGGKSSFPEKYHACVRPGVPYTELGDVYRRHAVGININTVKGSGTMFARRVFEMMACALPVISNESVGLHDRFGSLLDDPVQNAPLLMRDVFLHDTLQVRLCEMLQTVGLRADRLEEDVDVYCIGEKAGQVFDQIDWPHKRQIFLASIQMLEQAVKTGQGAYWIALDCDSKTPDIPFWLTQFAFLPEGYGMEASGWTCAAETMRLNVLYRRG